MKTKLVILAIAPLLFLQTGCQDNSTGKTGSNIHGSAGVGVESRDTSHIAPSRPAY
jgi:hypothetical protein